MFIRPANLLHRRELCLGRLQLRLRRGQIAGIGSPALDLVLRDFDGTRTIYPAELPLRDVILTEQTDLEFAVDKIYVRTDERDERGRIIYSERK